MATEDLAAEGDDDASASDKALADRWKAELQTASKAKAYKRWIKKGEKIIKRYRDERQADDSAIDSDEPQGSKFNILWSNVQTLQPALFAKPPKVVVERRYLDRDPTGRVASTIMERAISYEMESAGLDATIRRVVLDRLLPGRGVIWVRYQPTFQAMPSKTTDPEQDKTQAAEEEKVYECVDVDYVDWRDFLTAPVRAWEECPWIRREVRMTRPELVERFGPNGKRVKLDWSPTQDKLNETPPDAQQDERNNKGRVWEIWDKAKRQVIWISPGYDGVLDRKADPLKLDGFYPTPKPLSATLTNDSLIPVPDFIEYQDQARELDNLTARIEALTAAIKAAGVYDASIPELSRMLTEDFENRLVPCENWASFSEKMGSSGMGGIWLIPIKDMAAVLIQLYDARDRVKQVLYEVTGISDIVRGQASTGTAKTATEQRIKGQFASLRLNDMQADVARYVRDCLRLIGEVIAEHFDPMTLYLISGYEQYAQDQFSPQPQPGMGHNGGPPMEGVPQQPGMPPGMPMQPDPAAIAQQKAKEAFVGAIKLLKDERLRGFRIDIETDSIIEPDQQQVQQGRTEFLAAVGQFLEKAVPLGQVMPQFMPLLGKMLLFGARGFKAGRDLESALEQMVDDLQNQAKNPPPKQPSPEEIKAQAEIQKQQMEGQRMQMQAQIDQQKATQDLEMQRQKNAMDMERMQMELQMKREELELKRQEMQLKQQGMVVDAQIKQQTAAMDMQTKEREAEINSEAMERDAEINAQASEREAEAGERQHEQSLEVMDAKTKQAKQQASIKAKASGVKK